MAFNVDLSKFKKVKSDDKKTIMRHADGHELTIAHSALSKRMKEQLDQLESEEASNPKIAASKQHLSDGGEAQPSPTPAPKDDTPSIKKEDAEAFSKGASESGMKQLKEGWKNVKSQLGFADGGDVPADLGQDQPEDSNPALMGGSNSLPAPGAEPVSPQEIAQMQQNAASEVAATAPDQTASNPALESRTSSQSPAMEEQPKAPEAPAEPSIEEGYSKQQAGIAQQAKAEGELGKQQAAKYDKAIADQQLAAKSFQDANQVLNQERIAHVNDVQNNLINPEKYWDNHSKVATGIGLILAGFNPTNSPNAALEFLKSNIDQSVKAQEANLGAKQSLLSANLAQFKNLQDATNMTKLMQSDIVVNQLHQAAAKAQDPMAKARALQEAGKLEMEYAPLHRQMVMREALMQGAKGGADPTSFVPFVVPAPHQEAVYKEIERAQDTRHMGDSIIKSFDEAAKENTVARRIGLHAGSEPPQVGAFKQAMQPTFKDLEGTVRQAAMDNTFDNLTPRTTDNAHSIKVKRDSLVQYLQSKKSAPRAKSFGIDLDHYPSTQSPTGPAEVKTLNGVQYQKVQGGWKRVQ